MALHTGAVQHFWGEENVAPFFLQVISLSPISYFLFLRKGLQ